MIGNSPTNLAQMMLPYQHSIHSQSMMSQVMASAPVNTNPDIKIELECDELWRKFHQHTTEMIVNKTGRRMFPTLKFKISGLEPSTSYAIFLEIAPADECRYKYQNGRWLVNGRADPLPNASPGSRSRLYSHPDSPAPGHLWMRQSVSFHRIKLTNNIMDPQGNLLLNSMHKYQPRLFILKLHDYFPTIPQMVACASFPETSFVTVTAYQNNSIIQLKIDHNPFAKGFREHGLHIDKKRPSSAASDGDASLSQGSAKRLCMSESSEKTKEDPLNIEIPEEDNDHFETASKTDSSVSDCKTNSDTESSQTFSPLSVSVTSAGSAPGILSPRGSSFLSPVKSVPESRILSFPTPTNGLSGGMFAGHFPQSQFAPHNFLTPPFSPAANFAAAVSAASRFTPVCPSGGAVSTNPVHRFGNFPGLFQAQFDQSQMNYGAMFGRGFVNPMIQADQAQMLLAAAAGFRQNFVPNLGFFAPKP